MTVPGTRAPAATAAPVETPVPVPAETPAHADAPAPGAPVGTPLTRGGAVVGEDGRGRCGWGLSTPDYVAYHDDEWGVPLRGDVAVFERLSLEGFQSGLSWITILRKRDAFRAAFRGFDFRAVAEFDEADATRLLGDAGIVRHRGKIEAAIRNARATVALADAGESLSDLVWAHAPAPGRARPVTLADVPATTPESAALAKTLKKRGFSFVGPTTCYAMMQAIGVVDDHVTGCWRATD